MLNQKIQTVSTKGQVVIPAEYREQLGITPQIKVIVKLEAEKKRLILEPMEDPIQVLSGALKGKINKTAQQIKDEIRKEEAYYEKRKFGRFFKKKVRF